MQADSVEFFTSEDRPSLNSWLDSIRAKLTQDVADKSLFFGYDFAHDQPASNNPNRCIWNTDTSPIMDTHSFYLDSFSQALDELPAIPSFRPEGRYSLSQSN